MKVAIIGAGVSGAYLASRLNQAGFKVTVFEKARGAGGRTSSRRFEQYRINHGAQFIEGRDPKFLDFIKNQVTEGNLLEWKNYNLKVLDAKNKILSDDVSPKSTKLYISNEAMNSMAKNLLKGIEVKFSNRINHYLDLKNDFDFVVSTAPPAQTRDIFSGTDIRDMVKDVTMKACFAVMLITNNQFAFDFDCARVENSILEWINIRHQPSENNEVLTNIVLHTEPSWTKENAEMDPELVSKLVLNELQILTGFQDDNPVYSSTHRWLYSRTEKPFNADFIVDEQSQIACCGDWLLGDDIESAFLSADALARYLLI